MSARVRVFHLFLWASLRNRPPAPNLQLRLVGPGNCFLGRRPSHSLGPGGNVCWGRHKAALNPQTPNFTSPPHIPQTRRFSMECELSGQCELSGELSANNPPFCHMILSLATHLKQAPNTAVC